MNKTICWCRGVVLFYATPTPDKTARHHDTDTPALVETVATRIATTKFDKNVYFSKHHNSAEILLITVEIYVPGNGVPIDRPS